MELSPEHKMSGILAPLFALRGKNDLGVGDVGALRELVEWASGCGMSVVQLLPVNETGNDHSPYNAISSVALDPLTIELTVEALEDITPEILAEERERFYLRRMYEGPVFYKIVKPLKRAILHRAFERFTDGPWKRKDARAQAFQAWMGLQESWLPGFALFRVLMAEFETERWDQWPEDRRTRACALSWLEVQPAKTRKVWELRMREVMYGQWVAWMQWGGIKAYAEKLGVALMGDIPFGVGLYSADYFCEPEIFDVRWSGGAPPEPAFHGDLFTERWGQNWGVPLYRWDVLKKTDLHWWRQRVHKVREVFHVFRIDHVLGFYRVYGFPWRPERNPEFAVLDEVAARQRAGGELPRFHPYADDTEAHQLANRAHGEELLRALVEETGRYALIGEDLGTVPDYVRPSLEALDIAGFKVPMWEKEWDTRLTSGKAYGRLSVATYATHDHEPLKTMWERWMRTIASGDSGRAEDADARNVAWWEVRRLAAWAGFEVPRIVEFEQVHERLLLGLLACNSWMAVFMVTDLFGTAQRFNVPGAVADSNWSERIALPVSEWSRDRRLAPLLKRLDGKLKRRD
ncbi:MAG: 4-alpha-glucanotransferase [Verrucomicrobia bacterium]|nr:MAG: 4-alpha-glucanotransferase [Verrucomicrobiota bacterium]